MTHGRLTTHIAYSLFGALVFAGSWSAPVRAHGASTAAVTSHHHDTTTGTTKASGLVKVVREATERFRDVAVAKAEGYALLFGCVSGSDAGAMGLHYAQQRFM